MKTSLLIIGAVLTFARFVSAADSPPPPATTEVVNAGHAQTFDGSKQALVRFWLQQLMLSALYRDVVQDSSLEEWQRERSSPSRIFCRYPSGATLAIPERRTLAFEEALLPLPSDRYPDYLFLKRGDHVVRVAKYDPWVLYKLVSESGFPLYEGLSKVPRELF